MFSPALLSSFDDTAVQSEDGRELRLLLYIVGFNRFVVAGVWPRATRELLTREGMRWPTFSSQLGSSSPEKASSGRPFHPPSVFHNGSRLLAVDVAQALSICLVVVQI